MWRKILQSVQDPDRISELRQAVTDFVDAEEAVKTGRLQDVLSVELLIVKYSSARR